MESRGTDALFGGAHADMRADFVALGPVQTGALARALMAVQASGKELFALTPLPGTGTWRIIVVDEVRPLPRPTPHWTPD